MKKRELSVLIALTLSASIVLNTELAVKAYELNTKIVEENSEYIKDSRELIDKTADSIYLSEIEYDSSKSYSGYGEITKDTDIDGNTIKLMVDGETAEFAKGMAAHATSAIVYDISAYKDTYNRFISYVGIDKSQSGFGNGAVFSIYTSVDGSTWTLAKDLGVINSWSECAYVDIEIGGANYIKLYADDNGSDANDHAVYGDAKLVKKEYGGSSISGDILKEVSAYDDILRASSIEENLAKNELTILRRDFVNKIGYESLRRLGAKSPEYKDSIEYLLTDITALRYFVTGGPVNISGSYPAVIKYFADIYAKYGAELKSGSEDNFNLRLALSISLSFAQKDLSTFWLRSDKERNAVERYEIYKELISSGRMDKGGDTSGNGKWTSAQFKELPVTLMRWSVDNRINNDDILWLADYALSEKAKGRDYLDAYNYIEYTDEYDYDRDGLYDPANFDMYNDKYNIKGYFSDYGQKSVSRLWMVFEEGSVCGGLAKTYANLADTFGRPSSVVGQPGHAATITYDYNDSTNRYEWMIQNDISGWTESGNEYNDRMLRWGNQNFSKWDSASYTILATDAVKDYNNYVKAVELNILAEAYNDNSVKKEAYLKALDYQGINVDSMTGLINTYKADSSLGSSDYLSLGRRIINNFTYYPQAMVELLSLIKDNVTEASELVELDVLETNALLSASKADASQSTCVMATRQLADFYLGSISTELAGFSFDGENAGKIVVNSKYEASKIRIKYSLDGGNTWLDTDEHVISLTKDQIDLINSKDDIQVGLVGGSEIFTIDILDSKTITDTSIYRNDLENLLIGDTENLEFTLDGGLTWCNYVPGLNGTRITGDKTIKVRYKAHGHYLTGSPKEYTFTENTDTAYKSYLPLKNVTLVDFSSQQNDGDNAAANLIDGNNNTGWHTTFGHREENKFYTVAFDKVRYITSLEYISGGWNGKIKNAEVYTSLDGVNWTKSGSVTNLAGETINLDAPAACKYLKLVASETYGNSEGEANMYFSGKMLNFYEDTTKTYKAEAAIEYSITGLTNKDVTAKVTLPAGCTIIGNSSYVFENNGSFTFEFLNADNVKQTVEAKVNWIDKEAPKAVVKYDITSITSSRVTATLSGFSEEVTLINGSTHTFEKNGEYTFEFIDKAGNKGSVTAKVDWIKENGSSTDKPVEVPDTNKPEQAPGTEKPGDVPGTDKPEEAPDTEKPGDVPGSDKPEQVPDTEKPEDVPSIDKPEEVPGTGKPEEVPSAEKPEVSPDKGGSVGNTGLSGNNAGKIESSEAVSNNSQISVGYGYNYYNEYFDIEYITESDEQLVNDELEVIDNSEVIIECNDSDAEESMNDSNLESSNEEVKQTKKKRIIPNIAVGIGALLATAVWWVIKFLFMKKK